MTMTVEILASDDPKSNQVEILISKDDLESLINDLECLRIGKMDHLHFMSPDWGGDQLGTKPRRPTSQIAHHLRIDLVSEE